MPLACKPPSPAASKTSATSCNGWNASPSPTNAASTRSRASCPPERDAKYNECFSRILDLIENHGRRDPVVRKLKPSTNIAGGAPSPFTVWRQGRTCTPKSPFPNSSVTPWDPRGCGLPAGRPTDALSPVFRGADWISSCCMISGRGSRRSFPICRATVRAGPGTANSYSSNPDSNPDSNPISGFGECGCVTEKWNGSQT